MFHNQTNLDMATFKAITLSGIAHQKSDGTKNIKIRIYHNKSVQYIATDFYIEESFMGKDGQISPLAPNSDVLNFELGELIQKYRGICIKLGSTRLSVMSCIEVKEQIVASIAPDYESINFIEFAENIYANTKKENTAGWYRTAIDTLCWFYGRKNIDIRDITGNRIRELIAQLAEKGPSGKPLEPGAINNYLRGIRSLFNKAKKHYNNEDYNIIRVPNEPFKNITLPRYRRKKKNLPTIQIMQIRDYTSKFERDQIAQDVFMMMFYLMGINMSDLYKLRPPKYGRVEYERSKTDTENNNMFPLSIKIEPELQVLIDKYSEDGEFLSRIKKRYKSAKVFKDSVNIGLNEISEHLNLGVKVTTNWARHSWASIARNQAGIAKADIDFCLGHVNNDYKMADIYIDIDYTIFDKSNRAVLNLLKKESEKKKEYLQVL